jgi:tetratricopeptide (TPR) repeat protein
MKNKIYILLVLSMGLLSSQVAFAQENEISLQDVNQDDLGNVTDAFQENFFEALKQKGIENYEKAITALKVCEKIQPESAVVHFEMGKNYMYLKNYEAAVQSLQKANRLKPNQEWVLLELMEAHYQNRNYEPAILIAKNLISYDTKYQNNLADLYLKSQMYDELLSLLDTLDAQFGINEFRLDLRQQIYTLTNNTSAKIQTLKDAIKINPENEMNYLNLVFIYSEEGNEKQAFEAAEEMKKNFPTSKIVHLALYKFYLNSNNTKGALESMKIVLKAEEIDPESKFKVLNDFLNFVNANPQYEEELKEVTGIFSESESSPGVYQKLGEYFLAKDQKDQALTYFMLGIEKNLDDYKLLSNTLLLQLDLTKYKEAADLSEKALEIFPAQPFIYLTRGIALNMGKDYKEAEQILTFGLDYVIANPKMEVEFYEQLSIAYTGLGNPEKASDFQKKAKQSNKTVN